MTLGEILVLGSGAVVRDCFTPALNGLGLAEKTTVVDANPGAHQAQQRFVCQDFASFLREAKPAQYSHCIVALPNWLHHDAVQAALKLGLHVLCEKPLALCSSQCLELAALANARRRVLAVNMVRRLFHSIRTAVTVLRRGWLGSLRALRVSHGDLYGWPVSSVAPFEPRNGGVLADLGVHYLDLAEMMVGRLEPIGYCDDYAGGVESECDFCLRSESGVPVDIALSRLRKLENEIRLIGTSGQLRIGVDTFGHCRFEPSKDGLNGGDPMSIGSAERSTTSFADYFAEQLRRFVQSEFESTQGLVTALSAAQTTALIEWAYSRRRPFVHVSDHSEPRLNGPVFITGATGFVGSHLVDRLARDTGTTITAAYHSLRACAAISRYPIRYHATDVLSVENLRQAVRGHRYVFHLAYGRDPGTERAVTVDGTKNLVEACVDEGVEAVVILSTMYVLGQPGGVVDETCGYDPIGGLYGVTKARMERWCLERARSSKSTRVVVLIPTCVYGPRGRTYTEMPASLARARRFCWIEGGNGIANVTFVENLIDAMVRASLSTEAHGGRFIVNDRCMTWREFLSPIVGPWAHLVPSPTANEFRKLTMSLPGPGVRDVAASILRSAELRDTLAQTGAANQLRRLLRTYAPWLLSRVRIQRPVSSGAPATQRVVLPSWLAEVYGATTTRFSSARAREVLGWTPRVPLAAGVEKSVAWLRDQGLYETDPIA